MFKERIRELRNKNNYTQDDLAKKLNISRQSISKWENGLSYPTRASLNLICDIFNVQIQEIMDQDEVMLISIENNTHVKSIKKRNLMTSFLIIATISLLIVVVFIFNTRLNRLELEDENQISNPLLGFIILDQAGLDLYNSISDESTLLTLIESKNYPYYYFHPDSGNSRWDNNKLFSVFTWSTNISREVEATVYIRYIDNFQNIFVGYIYYDLDQNKLMLIPRITYTGFTPFREIAFDVENIRNEIVSQDISFNIKLMFLDSINSVDLYQYSESYDLISSDSMGLDDVISLNSETLYFIIRETYEDINGNLYIKKRTVHQNDFTNLFVYEFKLFDVNIFAYRGSMRIDTYI
jgi:transcriptional regulator with XRE-family HTH domain